MIAELTLPESMSPRERAAEIATLLATAVARLHASRPLQSEVSLGFSAPKRVHITPSPPGVPR
ncbi:hypothetical protein E4Q08_14140 [Candidatus Accumulibacter phosphatis]|uniref:Uncharacterized protein n=1 Tax=Candidatus Accumulibacter contiguus TaxID=2954381 RepID=A0ABX1T9F3_9PROT|nr:hypothetical protein [Candidatus Accumulibacter contiguus]